MTIKEKVLQALKTKYKDFGLSDKTLEAMASTLAAQLKEESEQSEIDDKVNGAENFLKAFQSEADTRVTEAVKKVKGAATQPQNDPNAGKGKDEPESEISKAVKAAIEPLVQKIAALEGDKVVTGRKQTLESKLANVEPTLKAKILKDFSRMTFESDEDFNSYIADTETDLGQFVQDNKGGGVPRPARPGGSSEKATEAEINAIVDVILP